MHKESVYYFLPTSEVHCRLEHPKKCPAKGNGALHFVGPWRHVRVKLHSFMVRDEHAWLPQMHAYVGKPGTRIQMEAENYVDLLAFRLYLRQKIDRQYEVPGLCH